MAYTVTLAEGYELYREDTRMPWELWVNGSPVMHVDGSQVVYWSVRAVRTTLKEWNHLEAVAALDAHFKQPPPSPRPEPTPKAH